MGIREDIANYRPFNEQERRDKQVILDFLDNNGDAFLRSNLVAHMTASAWIVNPERTKTLLVYHRIFDSWSWTGGHADGEEDLLAVALREVREETGVKAPQPVMEDIYSLEVLTVDGHEKHGEYVPSHLHMNVTYLLEADESETLHICREENSGVAWFSLEEALERLLRGDYTVEERMMLSGSIRRGDGSRETAQLDALNDVTVTRCGPMQVVPLRIWVNGQLLAGYGADGIVIATPTGSTGYNLSAGGPIVEPEAGLILLTPICPHTLNTRSVVLCDRDEVEVEIGRKPSGDIQEVEVSFDGTFLTRLRSGDRVRVRKSERTTSIIRLSEPAFLERLHRKMSE